MKMKEYVKKPIFFERNRVHRLYLGGQSFADFFLSEKEADNYYPEEWIASTVEANNSKSYRLREGVSIVRGTNIFFDELLEKYPEELLGNRKYDILVKLIDSAIRLPIQTHPTKEFSKKHLNCEYGKTEAWLIVDTRPGAKIYLGFNDKYTREYLEELAVISEHDKEIMTAVCQQIEVKTGDVFMINAGVAHAIGAG